MEFSVEHDNKTGKRQVVSTATITPETIQDRGLKVYDDGHKSVYAMLPDGAKMLNGAVGRMTPADVEELLNQATDKNVPTEVQYHQPVYSVPYPSGNRPSTPKTPNKSQQQTPPRSLTPFQDTILHRNEVKICKEDDRGNRDLEGWKTQSKTPSPNLIQQDSMSQVQEPGQETKLSYFDIPGQPSSGKHLFSQPRFGAKSPQSLTDSKIDVTNPTPAALVSVKARSEGMPAPKQPIYRAVDDLCLSPARHESEVDPDALVENSGDRNQHLPFCTERIASLNVINTLPEELSSEPLTMIFMGYENAEDEEEEDIQAELVIINTDDYEDDEGQSVKNESDMEECLSYHPEGYKSKVFQPKVGIAKVTGYRDFTDDPYTNWDDLELHKPTFIHKPGEHSP